MAVEREESVAVEGPTAGYPGPCLVTIGRIEILIQVRGAGVSPLYFQFRPKSRCAVWIA